ncbi:MAG: hypothetical protein QXO86_05895 [Nitrososphaerota archaeon]
MSIEERVSEVLRKCEEEVRLLTARLISDIEKETRDVLKKVLKSGDDAR